MSANNLRTCLFSLTGNLKIKSRKCFLEMLLFLNMVLKFHNIFKITGEENLVSLCKHNYEMLVLIN